MGCYEGWTHPNGFYANGLLPHESDSVTRLLDPDRWSMAEETTAELIACIQPNQLSEERRNAVASYVKRLIGSCFSCQVFTFGSVPLKTYLPDGDIDLTAFGNETLKDAWASEVRDMLEKEEKNDDAEFRVKEVQYIQAEVKLVKCLVDNIVVDISFNQLGGLCTLCFLEEVDSLVNQNHLFKRSIILIKAWCYYESRILGAHHGLISTYALETLVLYIFHVFNNSFAGPLEVLYRFLEFFSKFDWDRFCVSLWGPVPISLLPDMTADPPRKDGGELLLSKVFLDACSSVYSAFPSGQENHELPFVSKHFNVIDPLRTNNNLGRSVSKGNFFRIRSAFSYGAQRLAKLLDCPKEDITAEVGQFFMNTMERHGRGPRPDIPKHAVYGLQSANRKKTDETNSLRTSSKKNVKQNFSDHESEVEKTRVTQDSHGGLSRLSTQLTGRVPRSKNMSSVSQKQTQKTDANLTSSTGVSQNNQMSHGRGLNENTHSLKGRNSRADNFGNEIHATARNPFARTHSSPELKDTSNQFSSQGRNNRTSERTKGQAMARLDHGRSRNSGAEVSESNNAAMSSQENVSSFRHSSLNERIHESRESNAASNRYHDGPGSGLMNEDRSAAEAMQMQQEEQDLVNMMASSSLHNFNGNFHLPMNFASHLPIPMSPSVLASLGHAYRNSAGMVPTNMSSFESTPWGPNLHYPQGLMTFPMSQYFSSLGMAPKQQGVVEPVLDELMERETFKEDSDQGLWSDRDMDSVRGLDVDNQMLEENKQFIPGVHPGLMPGSRTDRRGFYRENFGGIPQHQNFAAGSDTYGGGTNFVAGAHGTSKVKESSEASSDGSSLGRPGPITYQQGRKFAPSVDRSAPVHENGWQHESELVDHVSSRADDDSGDWVPLSVTGKEIRDTVPGAVSSSNVRAHDIPGHELAQLNGSKPILPVSPMLVNSAMYQRANDNNDSVPLTFYPTGPPVPFVTMLPYYNYPSEKGPSDGNHIDRGERLVHSRISQFDEKIDSTENLDEIESLSCSSSAKGAKPAELSEEQKSDILNSDFASHWQNLQYGRVCQSPRDYGPMLYPPSVVVPPAFMQGQLPFDNPERPLSANANLFTQIMGYGPRLNPVSPLQPGSTRPLSSHGPYGDEVARYRGGTGTYLPNPAPFRERHPSSGRNRGNYSYDRNDHHGGDREGNWKLNSRQRYSGRGRGRNQFERANTRTDRSIPSNSRSDRPWNTFKPEPVNHSQNTPFSSSTSTQSGSSNVPYSSYPFQIVNRDGGPPGGGAGLPPFLMLYPYEQNMVCGSGEQLEFGSHGVPFSGMHEGMQQQLGEESFQNMQRNYRVNSAQSSPDKPSSPRLPR